MKKLKYRIITLMLCLTAGVNAQNTATEDEGVRIGNVIWATRNVDAPGTFAAKPEDAGMLYQWNRAVGWSSTEPLVNHLGGTVWNSSPYYESEWAQVWQNNVCPEGWRVPNNGENNTYRNTYYLGEFNGTDGWFVEGDDGKKLFFPAAGYRQTIHLGNNVWSSPGALHDAGVEGYYWYGSHTFSYWDPYYGDNHALYWKFSSGGNRNMTIAMSIRCVKDATDAAIGDVLSDGRKITGYYSLMGVSLQTEPENGIYIILYDNGTAEKKMK